MLKLRDGIIELYKKVATSIPPDVEDAIKKAFSAEENAQERESLSKVLEVIRRSRQEPQPACIETGIPTFKVKVPRGLGHNEIKKTIKEATSLATQKVPLSPGAVDVLTGENSGDNTGLGFPVVYLEEAPDDSLTIDLMLRAGDCENYSRTYRLPEDEIHAERNLDGVKKCVLHCVKQAEGRGCPPYTVGVGIGATQDQVAVLSVLQLFRKIPDSSEFPVIAELEGNLLHEINKMGIGATNPGGRSTAIGVKIGINHRHPESYLVNVTLSCWANRRGRLIW